MIFTRLSVRKIDICIAFSACSRVVGLYIQKSAFALSDASIRRPTFNK